ncbi:hypothetical protein [Phytomonospora endophytica]|uniref:SH3b domain-containing protein n=1 Tax=Phytomonospora endophytica TaxID=714109 RepID=A0A841FVG4_9ACTN|nr:hypothetical protein [Phytomonospora endophytica]MBB6039996.1 hypothetical protein [Phytomonospora endophytica]GIG71546.1 hypothetical protein Pen01_78410 [Phytomonospora endophytica]
MFSTLRRRAATNIAVVAMFVAGAVGFIAPSNAAADPGDVGVNGIGVGVHVTINNASLFQCPATNCNQGTAQPADDVADICHVPVSPPQWGGLWNLVLNHSNSNQVGWISSTFLRGTLSGDNCEGMPRNTQVTINNASLFQCPASNCNQGTAQPAHHLKDLCYVPLSTPWGNYWHLVLNYTNSLQVGWISGTFLLGPLTQTRC